MTRAEHHRVLLVEDNELDARAMTKALVSDGGCEIERVADLTSALDAIDRGAYDCVLLDLSLPDSDGLVSVETMVANSPHCPVVVLTGLDDPEVAVEAVARGAQDYLVKNTITVELVARAIRYAVARHSAETELVGVKQRLTMMHAREQIARDLHDTVIQRLFAGGMTLQAATRLASRDDMAERALVVIDEIDAAIRELREAIVGLHALEDDEVFAVEVTKLAEGFRDSLGFDVVVRLGEVPPLPDNLRQDVLAVLRESLSNVARHADATTATMTVMARGDVLMLRVTDNGKGTPEVADEVASGRGMSGNGLRNMRARAEAHGGTMVLDAGRHGGSELLWQVPLSP